MHQSSQLDKNLSSTVLECIDSPYSSPHGSSKPRQSVFCHPGSPFCRILIFNSIHFNSRLVQRAWNIPKFPHLFSGWRVATTRARDGSLFSNGALQLDSKVFGKQETLQDHPSGKERTNARIKDQLPSSGHLRPTVDGRHRQLYIYLATAVSQLITGSGFLFSGFPIHSGARSWRKWPQISAGRMFNWIQFHEMSESFVYFFSFLSYLSLNCQMLFMKLWSEEDQTCWFLKEKAVFRNQLWAKGDVVNVGNVGPLARAVQYHLLEEEFIVWANETGGSVMEFQWVGVLAPL